MSANAAASCSLSRSGNCTFNTTGEPSARVAGMARDANAYANGSPSVSDQSCAHASTMPGQPGQPVAPLFGRLEPGETLVHAYAPPVLDAA